MAEANSPRGFSSPRGSRAVLVFTGIRPLRSTTMGSARARTVTRVTETLSYTSADTRQSLHVLAQYSHSCGTDTIEASRYLHNKWCKRYRRYKMCWLSGQNATLTYLKTNPLKENLIIKTTEKSDFGEICINIECWICLRSASK